jgi:hypothetical protein
MKTLFADAFYFVALLNRADQHHIKTIAVARELRNDIVTSEWVLAEVADALAASSSRRLAAAFIRDPRPGPQGKNNSCHNEFISSRPPALRATARQKMVLDRLHFICGYAGRRLDGSVDGR